MAAANLRNAREVFTNVIGFDRSSVKPIKDAVGCDLNGWLSARPTAWRIDRTLAEELGGDVSDTSGNW